MIADLPPIKIMGQYVFAQKKPDEDANGKPPINAPNDLCVATPNPLYYGYYQPAGPLIKETGAETERALARYHPPPHYHPPHPSMIQQYGPPYYPAELCYGRYYRQPGPYHMPPPPQTEGQMVGVGSEPYPPPPYYGTPPCYQHSPQRLPYIEYRGCACPLNSCPKNVHIGPATGKAGSGGGPERARQPRPPEQHPPRPPHPPITRNTHDAMRGKDPPLEKEPPVEADTPHPCPLPSIGGASPKREMFDVRDNSRLAGDLPGGKLRLARDLPGAPEAAGPPSPARGSAGACPPQPPSAPRRARLGKAMARKSLQGDDTGLLISAPQPSQPNSSEIDDDVLAISPPTCAPIDLSSSDERSTPLVDVKKENEGPTYSSPRKSDAQALREHNSSTNHSEFPEQNSAAKAVKRRYSRPKLEIDMKDARLEEDCLTNGIGEHVKLQKRRKISSELLDAGRSETITKESKKRSPQKRTTKSLSTEKKSCKRKTITSPTETKVKKMLLDTTSEINSACKPEQNTTDDLAVPKSKTKSAILLDKLIRKNSLDAKLDSQLSPAELFLPLEDSISKVGCATKTLNINNNFIEKSTPVNNVRPKTIAAVSLLINKKLASKNLCKTNQFYSQTQNNLAAVLSSTEKSQINERISQTDDNIEQNSTNLSENIISKVTEIVKGCEKQKDIKNNGVSCEMNSIKDNLVKTKSQKLTNNKIEPPIAIDGALVSDITATPKVLSKDQELPEKQVKRCSLLEKINHEAKARNLEKVAKLLVSRKSAEESISCEVNSDDPLKSQKRSKLDKGECKKAEKVVKLLVSKKPAIKMDEAALVIEEACSPKPMRKTKRRRRGFDSKSRAALSLPPPQSLRGPPRWSNGWKWDGEDYISKVYLNNDSRLDRTARCYARMSHTSGDSVGRGDCVLLRASVPKAQPFVARIARLWENPDDGEMMLSLVWYYRPEHTEMGRQPVDAPDEVFASRHRDANSVACIEDKCYVLTFNEYCRYRKRLKAAEQGVTIAPSIVPQIPASDINPAIATNDSKLPPSVSPELVLFCRKIYDFRSKKLQAPNK